MNVHATKLTRNDNGTVTVSVVASFNQPMGDSVQFAGDVTIEPRPNNAPGYQTVGEFAETWVTPNLLAAIERYVPERSYRDALTELASVAAAFAFTDAEANERPRHTDDAPPVPAPPAARTREGDTVLAGLADLVEKYGAVEVLHALRDACHAGASHEAATTGEGPWTEAGGACDMAADAIAQAQMRGTRLRLTDTLWFSHDMARDAAAQEKI